MNRGFPQVASAAGQGLSRLTRALGWTRSSYLFLSLFAAAVWATFLSFYALMLAFVWPTRDKSLTLGALGLSAILMLTPTDHRAAVLTFLAGTGLGYFLERWGTTRECWIYYTRETPPFFAVLAHGMAAVAFWRAGLVIKLFQAKLLTRQRAISLGPPSHLPAGRRRGEEREARRF